MVDREADEEAFLKTVRERVMGYVLKDAFYIWSASCASI